VRGAFTGAARDRVGLFEHANGGTLFLDEIGELPMTQQSKLLRALESRTIRPVGASAPRPVDVRVIAATNRRLDESVNEGTFREDLYYRLAVLEIDLPPLRARREDVPSLAAHFYALFSNGAPLPEDWVPALVARNWPGNVRELRNFLQRAVACGLDPQRRWRPLPANLEGLVPIDQPLKRARAAWDEQLERVYVQALLTKTGGDVASAAVLAGVSVRTIQRIVATESRSLSQDDDDTP
jgi:transcriptional regulator with PAS, ATPase and Fis domain